MKKDTSMLNSFDASRLGDLSAQEAVMIKRRNKVLGPAYRLFYQEPLHIVRGEGVYLYDQHGKPYLDAYNNVASIGHSRPEVVEAIARQASILNTHTRYLHELVIDYAECLTSTFPADLSQVMFTCTGSEANDLALRIAKRFTGATGIIVTQLAYHGVTASIAKISPSLGGGVPLGQHVRAVEAPDTYLFSEEDIGARFAKSVGDAIADLKRHGIKPAALIVDSIFSSDGVYSDPKGFLKQAVNLIRAEGGIYIADEVQSGFARTGSAMWGFQRHGLTPDIVTIGKPMGNGHPIAGLVAKPEVLQAFGDEARYFNTFGGNPVSCAAAMATLRVIQNDKLQENSARIGALIKTGFRALAEKIDLIGDVRGDGLFIGVELVCDRKTKEAAKGIADQVVNGMRERGVLISATGPRGNVLKIRPLLTFNEAHAQQLLTAVTDSLESL
ncbi:MULTISPECIES: aspartate aminotransferase family protein [unclassified Pseudomonas]|uniref:aspartate aminotransferase family protein n=1 Tax=unclassified Pseudomonas TaxID=196821 RepID=UPI00215C6756|nr:MULTISPECIES: aminotransferase class III-fold pyridoxal phosphate-dependent enzyme [unclassified Pseudomonas]MCR8932240.1 aminotransferase class III-fold pyridoxal phosphate-dependent enzyme [Pseudomonas sp. S11A4]MCR8975847.1 aminotransferase class III-fold pyridoxal phosphate-dependent enzyme [Pseudomonas sp. S11P7]